ncbi:MAG: zinc-dependent metalloprotease [Proteobacteria bacterium]|nr:zinc-dependent metalloprotease [Pseudomonadota bacterium]
MHPIPMTPASAPAPGCRARTARPRRRLLALAGSLALAVLAACAGEGDLDRTQANRLPKSLFSGTWYLRSTVIGVPGTATASWIGQTGALEKVRWDIQEKWLIAYRAYEEVPGTDSAQRGKVAASEYRENPVAAFPIESHFDLRRNYNPTTGEQLNVIEENTSDRPWHEREWLRVDWATSQVDGRAFSGAAGRVPYQARFFVQAHEQSADAPRFIDREGRAVDFDALATVRQRPAATWGERIGYFDMVGKFLLEPEEVKLRFGGSEVGLPLCWFQSYRGQNFQTASCGPTEVRVRTAFLRAGERNFEPVPLPNREMGKFGYFRTERFTWDRRYGLRESGRVYLADVHNIWKAAYRTDAQGKLERDADGAYVPIPLAERDPKPIVYHLNEDFPCELISSAQQTAAGWNRAFRRAVAVAKGLLQRTSGDSEAELAAIGRDAVPDMFVLNLNGWVQQQAGDDWSCSNLRRDPARVEARLGDLRYSFLAWVPDRQLSGPLGYGPHSADPETGEVIAGMAHVYGAAVDEYASTALEIIRVLNNDLSIDDLTTGADVRRYLATVQKPIDPAKIPAEAAQLRGEPLRQLLLGDDVLQKLAALRERGLERANPGASQARRELVAGSSLAAPLVDDEIVRALAPSVAAAGGGAGARLDPASLPAELRDALSPLQWASPAMRQLDELRTSRAAAQTLWLAEFAADSIQGLAEEVWRRFGAAKDYDAMWQHLRQMIFRAVMEHEVGHTVGLRHNFAGSYDSVNYFNQYWDLRAPADAQGKGGLIERDPLAAGQSLTFAQLYQQAQQTPAQISGRMREYQYSSIMDYHAKFNSDAQGIGKYDEAAILFGYGGHVEVFERAPLRAKVVLRDRFADCLPRYESIPNPAFDYLLEQWHYSSVWNLLGGKGGLVERRFRRWSELNAEQQQATEQCRAFVTAGGEKVADYVAREDTQRDAEVPYMFCGDEYAGATQSCQRWDEGADPREQVQNVIDSYRSYYFFNNFKRDRFAFDAYSVFRRVAGRYFSYLPNTYQHWLFQTVFRNAPDAVQANYWTIGAYTGFNLLMDVLAKPSYGTYCRFDPVTRKCSATGPRWGQLSDGAQAPDGNRLVIERGPGRRRFSRFDYSAGYNYQDQVLESGHFWESLAALEMLTQSVGTFVGRETGSDFTSYLVPYYLTFDQELTRHFDGILTEDYERYGPRVVGGALRTRPARPLRLRAVGADPPVLLDPATGERIDNLPAGEAIDLQNWFTQQYYTLVLGMLELRSLYSLRFVDRQQVFRLGSGEQVTPAPGKDLLSCADPLGGHLYSALRDPAVADDEQPAAVKMVRQCQTEATAYLANPTSDTATADLNDTIKWLNLMRGLYSILGTNLY